jgi:hypothetical protein
MAEMSADFGATVRQWLAARTLSFQEAARESNGRVSYGTWRSAALGVVPNAELIVEMGDTLGRTPEERAKCANELLEKGRKRLRYAGPRVRYGVVPGASPVGAPLCSAAG